MCTTQPSYKCCTTLRMRNACSTHTHHVRGHQTTWKYWEPFHKGLCKVPGETCMSLLMYYHATPFAYFNFISQYKKRLQFGRGTIPQVFINNKELQPIAVRASKLRTFLLSYKSPSTQRAWHGMHSWWHMWTFNWYLTQPFTKQQPMFNKDWWIAFSSRDRWKLSKGRGFDKHY